MADQFRVIIPMARLSGVANYRTRTPEYVLLKTLLEAVVEARGSVSALMIKSVLPHSMIAHLISEGVSRGILKVEGGRIVIEEEYRDSMNEGTLDLLMKATPVSIPFEFVMDLSIGRIHDTRWALDHRIDESRLTDDIILQNEVDQSLITRQARKNGIRKIITMSDLRGKSVTDTSSRIPAEKVDTIERIEITGFFNVAVTLKEMRTGDFTRWLVEHDTPYSVLSFLISRKPELFKLRYDLREGMRAWEPTATTVLLKDIDHLWEKVQNATLTRISQERRKELSLLALKKIRGMKEEWKELERPYSDAKSLKLWFGAASVQGDELARYLRKVKKKVVILTSFLNDRHARWVAQLLSNVSENVHILILYGHANQETITEQRNALESYRAEIAKHLKMDLKMSFGITTRRSHEKIIVADDSSCVIGSWNVCSSNPDSDHIEVCVRVKSKTLASKLCDVLEKETDEESKKFLSDLRGAFPKTRGVKGRPLMSRIETLERIMESALNERNAVRSLQMWRNWRIQLLGLRDLIWTHYESPPISIVESESLRDFFVQLIRSSESSILIATDRVNPIGLDESLERHLLEKKRLIRIVWGMESPHWDLKDDPDASEELDTASETLKIFMGNGKGSVLTSLAPMLNHSKLIVVDENRVLISSNNFLAKGMEPTEESSREIGIMIESPLLARQLLGDFMLLDELIRGSIDMRSRSGQPWDLFELVRKSVDEVWKNDQISNHGRPDIVEFAIQSRFRDFSENGEILGACNGEFIPSDRDLSDRWETCMRFFGKGKLKQKRPTIIPIYEEYFLTHVYEMIGIQRVGSGSNFIIRPRTNGTFVPLDPVNAPMLDDSTNIKKSNKPVEGRIWSAESQSSEMLYLLRIGKEKEINGSE